MYSRSLIAAILFASTAFAASLPRTAKPDIVWKGCGITKKAFLSACAEAYTESTGITVEVSGGGATKGIAAAGNGEADFGGTCRGCLDSMDERELDLTLTVVAWDALVPIVHPDNPIESLTHDQVAGILQGSISDWSEVGGKAGSIDVLVRDGRTSGVGYSVRAIMLGNVDARFTRAATSYSWSGPLEQQIERKKSSFAITGVSSARLRDVKILGIDGVAASTENIATGEYAYYRPLYLAHDALGQNQRAFLDWLLSTEGQAIVAAQGTVTLDAGWRLPVKFDHWTEVQNIENLDDLKSIARERMATLGH